MLSLIILKKKKKKKKREREREMRNQKLLVHNFNEIIKIRKITIIKYKRK